MIKNLIKTTVPHRVAEDCCRLSYLSFSLPFCHSNKVKIAQKQKLVVMLGVDLLFM